MTNTAYRVTWDEAERGWGIRPDGYSVHATLEDVKTYVESERNRLPAEIPDEYSFPSSGWREPVLATPIEIKDGGLLAVALAETGSVRVFVGELRDEVRNAKITGESVEVSCGETPYTPSEQAFLDVRRQMSDLLDSPESVRRLLENIL